MASLTRAQIEAAKDLAPHKEVEVPEWGGSVFVRQMTAGEHAMIGVEYKSVPDGKAAFYLLGKTLCDDSGALLFPDPTGLEALAAKNPKVIDRLFEEASAFNRLKEADVEAAAKN